MTTATQAPLQQLTLDTAVVEPHFVPFDLPASNQRRLGAPHPEGAVIPLALRPSEAEGETTLDSAIETVTRLQEKGTLTALLATHGAILFRGVPVHDAKDFSRFAHAFGYAPHEIIGIVSVVIVLKIRPSRLFRNLADDRFSTAPSSHPT